MSTHTSPIQVNHVPPSYTAHTASLTSTPTSHLADANSTFDSVHSAHSAHSAQSAHSLHSLHSSYSDIKGEDVSELDLPTPSKGKNGATGPADGKAKPHVCQTCQRGFTTGGHLQRHQRIHTGVKAFKCPFPGCETRTSRQDNLQQHYRTHLSPTLRRGSGSQARAAVNEAMEAAGLKSTVSRAPRKSKGSGGGTPSSASNASTSHVPSPYQTPNAQGPGPGPGPPPGANPYAPYGMYDPQTQYAYPIPPHHVPVTQTNSTNSSRVPSPANGHSSGHSSVNSIPAHHQQPYFPQPFSPYGYPGAMQHQAYRYPAGGLPSPYATAPHAHHALYSPGIAADHSGQPMYSPIQHSFQPHSRESSYGVLAPGYGQNPMANGYPPPRTQTSTPLSQTHEDAYRQVHRPPSPSMSMPGRRRTPPHDMLSQGVMDPSSLARPMPPGMQHAYGAYVPPPHMSYGYHTPQSAGPLPGQPKMEMGQHRGSMSSGSEGSGNGGSDGSAKATLAG